MVYQKHSDIEITNKKITYLDTGFHYKHFYAYYYTL